MRLTGLYIGQSAMAANGAALAFSADNIANSNTTGYKYQRPDFASLVADASGGRDSMPGNSESGDGVASRNGQTILTQGGVDVTGRDLDSAIQGNGYFVVREGNDLKYTRAGNFTISPDGFLQTATGELVMGYTAASPDTLTQISLDNISVNPTATTGAVLGGNLDSSMDSVPPPTNPTTFEQLSGSAAFSSFTDIYDSLGNRHSLSLYFYHMSNQPSGGSTWQVQVYAEGAEVGQTENTPVPLGNLQLNFDSNGSIVAGSNTAMSISPAWISGAAQNTLQLDFGELRSFASPSYLSFLSMDGSAGGSATSIGIEANGDVVAKLDGGQTTAVGTLAIATFRNPSSLTKGDDNTFYQTPESGAADVARPGTNGKGSIVSGSLESSNVDMAKEFIDVVRYQRGYQAGSRIIQTIDKLIDATLQIA